MSQKRFFIFQPRPEYEWFFYLITFCSMLYAIICEESRPSRTIFLRQGIVFQKFRLELFLRPVVFTVTTRQRWS